jgi:hypothetical protein
LLCLPIRNTGPERVLRIGKQSKGRSHARLGGIGAGSSATDRQDAHLPRHPVAAAVLKSA